MLIKAFKRHENHVNEIAMLQSLKQNQSESVEIFCNIIKKNLAKLKSVVPIGASREFWFQHTERYAIQCLEDGLRDVEVPARLVAEKKSTLQAAAQFAVDTVNRLNKNISDAVKDKPNRDYENKSTLFCNYCKKKGHKIDNCELRNKKNGNSTNSSNSSQTKWNTDNRVYSANSTHKDKTYLINLILQKHYYINI